MGLKERVIMNMLFVQVDDSLDTKHESLLDKGPVGGGAHPMSV